MKVKKILFVNWGTKDKQYTFQAAKEKGLEIFLATSKNYPNWIKEYVTSERIIITNTYISDLLIKDVKTFIKDKRIIFDGVTTFFEMNIVQTSELAKILKTNFINSTAAQKSSANKYLMRMACQKSGINNPKFDLFENAKDGLKKLDNFNKSVVIKPTMSGHSYGVIKVSNKNDFLKKYKKAIKQMSFNFDEWMKYYGVFYEKKFLMEEYVEGTMVSIDGLIQNGKEKILSVTQFGMSKEPLFLQQQTYIPAIIDKQTQEKCKSETRKIYKALGFDNCGIHCEMKIDKKNKPTLIEIAARLPGGQILEGYKEIFNIDLASLYLDICLGKEIKNYKLTNKGFLLQETIPFKNEGIVKKINFKTNLKDKTIKIFSICKKNQLIKCESGIFPPIIYFQIMANNLQNLKNKREIVINNIHIKTTKNWEYYYLIMMNNLYTSTPVFLRKIFLGRGILTKFLVFLQKTNRIIKRSKRKF